MKQLPVIKELDLTINNKPRLYTDPIHSTYGKEYKFHSLTRWLARWYKCYCYTPHVTSKK